MHRSTLLRPFRNPSVIDGGGEGGGWLVALIKKSLEKNTNMKVEAMVYMQIIYKRDASIQQLLHTHAHTHILYISTRVGRRANQSHHRAKANHSAPCRRAWGSSNIAANSHSPLHHFFYIPPVYLFNYYFFTINTRGGGSEEG